MDPLILFRMLGFQQLFKLSDEELKFQVNDRRSSEEVVSLGVMHNIADATTVALLNERVSVSKVLSTSFTPTEKASPTSVWRNTYALRGWRPVVGRSLR